MTCPGDESTSASQSQTSSNRGNSGSGNQRRGRPSGRRPNGRGAHRGGRNAPTAAVNDASTPATATITPTTQHPNPPFEASRRSRGRQRNGRGGRGVPTAGASIPGGLRSFGGHLTTEREHEPSAEADSAPSLNGDAPEFVPGQPLPIRSKRPAAKKKAAPTPRGPKSTAADLGTRIHEDISNINYECTICTEEVLRTSHVWSCTKCWTVIHLKCVRKWFSNQKSQDELQTSEPQSEFFWRCPGCNSKLSEEPAPYQCWCGKEQNPRPVSEAMPPHSCGQTCSKPRPTCPHPCMLQCHAGPCPPCDLIGPVQDCFCGKQSSQKLCRETDYENGWSCQEPCGDLLLCGEHYCSTPCHPGLCGDCSTVVDAKCYCGRVEKQMPCSERDEVRESYSPDLQSPFEGSFDCGRFCERLFDCGVHKCSETCHPQEEQPTHCPFSPDVVTRCPCGKASLENLLQHPRQTCEDKIPHCQEPCGKMLRCGHHCKAKCHIGDCDSCDELVDISCRCGRTTTRSLCHQGDLHQPMCMRICQANLSCGRHKCGEHCCPGEKKATERLAAKRKNKLSGQNQTVEAEHICIRTCGRALKCGNHSCQQLCHRGPCGSCPEAIFHEISCNCGKTVLQPPQPCGTLAPECRFNCPQSTTCGHPPIEHNCHTEDVSCPKCPFLVDKWCVCGKEKLHSQPCHLQEPHCGHACGEKLKCGLHNCKKLCHKQGECEDQGSSAKRCEQLCGKTKMFCEHSCQQMCHGQTPCNEGSPCQSKTTVSCPCGQHSQQVRCLASSANPEPPRPELKCDDECLRLERNRRLASALNIDPATHTNDHVPYSDTTLALFQEMTAWAEAQEREFRVFAKSPNETHLRYKPMPNDRRQFLHALAGDYGLGSRSEDVEPHRYVQVYKTPTFVSAPGKTLAQCVKIRKTQAAEAAAVAAAAKPRTPSPGFVNNEPYNALLLTAPRFGLTVDELSSNLQADFASQPSFTFRIEFLPSHDEIAVKATAHYSAFLSPSAMEQALTSMKSRLGKTVSRLDLAGSCILCHLNDAKMEVTRRENVSQPDASGWSAVAGRAAAKKDSLASAAAGDELGKGSGRRLLGLKKKKVEKEPPAPWTSGLDGDVEC